MKKGIRYKFNAIYKTINGIYKLEFNKNFDEILTTNEEKKELFEFNNLLKKDYKAEVIITSSITNLNNNQLKEINTFDLNKLKGFISDEKELENFNKIGVIEQLISVIDEMSEFEIETGYEDETDLIDWDEIKNNREDIIKKGLCTMKEIYKFLVKLGFNNEEINKWLDEIR